MKSHPLSFPFEFCCYILLHSVFCCREHNKLPYVGYTAYRWRKSNDKSWSGDAEAELQKSEGDNSTEHPSLITSSVPECTQGFFSLTRLCILSRAD